MEILFIIWMYLCFWKSLIQMVRLKEKQETSQTSSSSVAELIIFVIEICKSKQIDPCLSIINILIIFIVIPHWQDLFKHTRNCKNIITRDFERFDEIAFKIILSDEAVIPYPEIFQSRYSRNQEIVQQRVSLY